MGAIWSRLQKPSTNKDQKDTRSRGRTRTRTPPPFKEDSSVRTHSTDPIDMVSPANISVPNTGNNHQYSSNKSLVTPHEFVWKKGGNKVCLTGSFDGWNQSVLMTRDQNGSYRAIINLREGEKQLFKFVVDGVWRCSLDFPCETDGQGNVNNVLYPTC